jgi:HD-GYP domain-containing protein (c-di-GMP phosphodiesterase class II)
MPQSFRFDGSGYPLGLKGGEIPLKARILCVADAWDAMLSKRPYRDPLSLREAKEELRRHGGPSLIPRSLFFASFMPPE